MEEIQKNLILPIFGQKQLTAGIFKKKHFTYENFQGQTAGYRQLSEKKKNQCSTSSFKELGLKFLGRDSP